VRVCKVNGPDPRPRAEVEDTVGVAPYGGKIEAAAEGEVEDVVEEVKVILCCFVIGAPERIRLSLCSGRGLHHESPEWELEGGNVPVRAPAIAVVSSPILVNVTRDLRV
jgi:hypothetical protein